MDSLLALELRSWFAKEFKSDVAIFEIMDSAAIRCRCYDDGGEEPNSVRLAGRDNVETKSHEYVSPKRYL